MSCDFSHFYRSFLLFFLKTKLLLSKSKHIGCDFFELIFFFFVLKLLKHVVNYKIVIKLSNLMFFIYYFWMYYKCTSVNEIVNK